MSLDPCYSRDKSPLKHNNESLIKDLVKKRGVVKGRLTKFSNYLSLLKSETMSTQSRIDLKLRVQGAANLFNEFNIIQNKLEELASDVDEQLTQREIFEDSYYAPIRRTLVQLHLICRTTAAALALRVQSAMRARRLPLRRGNARPPQPSRRTCLPFPCQCKNMV
ncbi:hypothetical protein ACJJTC_012884 [Scirpophaga incertulas]